MTNLMLINEFDTYCINSSTEAITKMYSLIGLHGCFSLSIKDDFQAPSKGVCKFVIPARTCADVEHKGQCLACLVVLLQLHPCRFGQGITVLVIVHTLYTTLYAGKEAALILHSVQSLFLRSCLGWLIFLFRDSHGSHAVSTWTLVTTQIDGWKDGFHFPLPFV